MASFNFAPNLEIKSLNKFSHQMYLGPISDLIRQVLKSAMVLLYCKSLTDFSELSINVLVLRWSKATQELSLELSPRRDFVIGKGKGCGDADNKEGQRVPTRGPARKKWEQQGPASSGVRRGVAGAAVWLKNGCAPAGWGCRRQMGAATATIEARMRCGSRKRRRRYCASTGKKERAAAEEAAGKQRQRGRVAGSGQRRQVRSREEGSAEGVRLERRRRQRRCAAAAVGEEEKKRQRRQLSVFFQRTPLHHPGKLPIPSASSRRTPSDFPIASSKPRPDA
ncbi:hypothetical protein BHE74_00041217 [Ensete ventricosum]|nr:hypothetical protein BHE74_00041217 [Ensete ventricosum]